MQQYQEAVVDGTFDPPAVVARLAAAGLFTEYVAYERDQRWYFAADPAGMVLVDGTHVRSAFGDTATTEPWSGTPWRQVRAGLALAPVADWNAYGWACFELASQAGDESSEPLAHLMIPRIEVQVTRQQMLIRSLDAELSEAVRKHLGEPSAPVEPVAEPVEVRSDDGSYVSGVAHAVSEIGRGRLRKAILSRRVEIPFTVDLPASYLLGRRNNTPARSFLLDLGGWQAAGFSPETVVEVDTTGTASTQPLAGTRALTGDTETDAALRAELAADPKEIYEHAASVKLAFEEMAGVGREQSTRVSEFLTVKARGSVQHLASRVATALAAGQTAWDALGAVFPPVTASGIPKAAAYRLIEELEEHPRGLYAGTVLMGGSDGTLDAALVLRAVYQREGRAWLRAGAGVVGVSRPDREYEETCEKLSSVAPYLVPAS